MKRLKIRVEDKEDYIELTDFEFLLIRELREIKEAIKRR